jgi:hypothetical protein
MGLLREKTELEWLCESYMGQLCTFLFKSILIIGFQC